MVPAWKCHLELLDSPYDAAIKTLLSGMRLQSQRTVVRDAEAAAGNELLTRFERDDSLAQHALALPENWQRRIVHGEPTQIKIELPHDIAEEFVAVEHSAAFVAQRGRDGL